LCTDGLANVGLGALEDLFTEEQVEEAAQFYTEMGQFAKEKGVAVSLISIVSEGCRLNLLSPITELTGGDLLRVDPKNIEKDFSNILSDAIIATNVQLKVKLHQGLEFRNEEPENISKDKSMLTRDVGNVDETTEITFEYTLKSNEELAQMANFDLDLKKKIPFQTQITYKSNSGMNCVRVISQEQDITHDKEEAKEAANYDVLSVNAVQKTGNLVKAGKNREAQSNILQWRKVLKKGKDYNKFKEFSSPIYYASQEQNFEKMELLLVNMFLIYFTITRRMSFLKKMNLN
jgi:hypothetical protein